MLLCSSTVICEPGSLSLCILHSSAAGGEQSQFHGPTCCRPSHHHLRNLMWMVGDLTLWLVLAQLLSAAGGELSRLLLVPGAQAWDAPSAFFAFRCALSLTLPQSFSSAFFAFRCAPEAVAYCAAATCHTSMRSTYVHTMLAHTFILCSHICSFLCSYLWPHRSESEREAAARALTSSPLLGSAVPRPPGPAADSVIRAHGLILEARVRVCFPTGATWDMARHSGLNAIDWASAWWTMSGGLSMGGYWIGSELQQPDIAGHTMFVSKLVPGPRSALAHLPQMCACLLWTQGGWLHRVTAAWQHGRVSNFDYLLYLNLAAGAS